MERPEDDEELTLPEAVDAVLSELGFASDALITGWTLVIEAAPASGGQSVMILSQPEQGNHRTLGQLTYAGEWTKNEIASEYAAYIEDEGL